MHAWFWTKYLKFIFLKPSIRTFVYGQYSFSPPRKLHWVENVHSYWNHRENNYKSPYTSTVLHVRVKHIQDFSLDYCWFKCLVVVVPQIPMIAENSIKTSATREGLRLFLWRVPLTGLFWGTLSRFSERVKASSWSRWLLYAVPKTQCITEYTYIDSHMRRDCI